MADRYNAVFIPILQPIAYVGKPNISHLKLGKDDNIVSYYSRVLELLQTPAYQSLSRNFLDLSQSLNTEELVYIDFCHLSPNGNDLIAGAIYRHLQEVVKE